MLLHYSSVGMGQPIILIHGYLSSSQYWHGVIPELSRRHRVITIDLLGFGDSPKPRSSDYSLETHTAAVQRTIYSIIGNTSYILVGHSMGALISGEIAKQTPERLDHLILLNMPIFTHPLQARSVFAHTSHLYKTMLYTPLGRVGWPLLKAILKSPLIRTVPQPLRPIAKSSSKNTHTSRKRSLKNTIEATDGRSLLADITVKTQFIGGTKDRSIYQENLSSFNAPDTMSIHWHDSGHHTIAAASDLIISAITQPTIAHLPESSS